MSYLRRKYQMDSDSNSDNENEDLHCIIQEAVKENKIQKNITNIDNQNKSKEKICTKTDEELTIQYNELLKKYWGYEGLKPTQFEIIKKVVEENKDVCAVLATGFGKSLCYQLPYLITQKNVIVISPLIALMHEQGQEMVNKGIPTAVFNSDTSTKKKNEEKIEIMGGINKLIFMTPEFFIKSEEFVKSIQDNLTMVCIDEAHAVSTWGLDFRPGYTELKIIKDWVPEIPILTLTATASTKVRADIYKILKLSNPELIIGNFDRPNLLIRVLPRKNNIIDDIQELLEKYAGEYVIIYCKTRDDTELVADQIRELGINANSYHAGMGDKNRKQVQQDFIDGKVKCMCATIAFGMGINIPGVRLVVHYNCPKNLESYYQEIGRAGRDGKPSECVLFYSAKDFQINRFLIKDMVNYAQKSYQEEQIRQIEKYIYATVCRRKVILANFGQTVESCSSCDNCIRTKSPGHKSNLNDYTCPVYLLLNILFKTNGKFGFGICVSVLLGKESKVKEWMLKWSEYGSGIAFGNDVWWKELVRNLITCDYVIETQAPGMFYSTTSLTEKGKELRNKLNNQYPTYLDLLKDLNNSNSLTYQKFIIKFPEIKCDKTTKSAKSTKSTKSTKSSADKTVVKTNKSIVKPTTTNTTTNTTTTTTTNIITESDIKNFGIGSNSTKSRLSKILNSDESDSD